jgi:hypothetical protein
MFVWKQLPTRINRTDKILVSQETTPDSIKRWKRFVLKPTQLLCVRDTYKTFLVYKDLYCFPPTYLICVRKLYYAFVVYKTSPAKEIDWIWKREIEWIKDFKKLCFRILNIVRFCAQLCFKKRLPVSLDPFFRFVFRYLLNSVVELRFSSPVFRFRAVLWRPVSTPTM